MKLKILKAGNGDSILINYYGDDNNNHNILIDGGNKGTYSANLKEELKGIIGREEVLDLLIVTHIDIDHIGGIIKMFDDIHGKKLFHVSEDGEKRFLEIRSVWFNANKLLKTKEFLMSPLSNKISEADGADLELYLAKTGFWTQKFITRPEKYTNESFIGLLGAKITLLAPEKDFIIDYHKHIEKEWNAGLLKHENKNHEISLPDSEQAENNKKSFKELLDDLKAEQEDGIQEDIDMSESNLSSIALLFEFKGKSALLIGDSPSQIIVKSLHDLGYTNEKPLEVDFVKLSHHASIKSTTYELLSLIKCKKFIISTNGKNHNLPNKKALAKIILSKGDDVEFHFNHSGEDYDIDFYRENGSDQLCEIDERDELKFQTLFNRNSGSYDL